MNDVEAQLDAVAREYEGKAAALRSVISDIRTGRIVLNGAERQAIAAHPAMRSRSPHIRSYNKIDIVRKAISRLGESFTPSDVIAAFEAGVDLPRTRITTILHRLARKKELSVERAGIGGVEPRYRKASK